MYLVLCHLEKMVSFQSDFSVVQQFNYQDTPNLTHKADLSPSTRICLEFAVGMSQVLALQTPWLPTSLWLGPHLGKTCGIPRCLNERERANQCERSHWKPRERARQDSVALPIARDRTVSVRFSASRITVSEKRACVSRTRCSLLNTWLCSNKKYTLLLDFLKISWLLIKKR